MACAFDGAGADFAITRRPCRTGEIDEPTGIVDQFGVAGRAGVTETHSSHQLTMMALPAVLFATKFKTNRALFVIVALPAVLAPSLKKMKP